MAKACILTLREKLAKLKDKEARLEADLALRRHPEIEDGIVELILRLADFKKQDSQYQIVSNPIPSVRRDSEALANQIATFQGMLDRVEKQLAEGYTEELVTRKQYFTQKLTSLKSTEVISLDSDKIQKKRLEALRQMEISYNKWADVIEERGINLKVLLPTVCRVLEMKE